MSEKYLKRGVSSQKEDVHSAIKNLDKGLYPNAFCKVTPDYLGNDEEWCNIMHSDGAGTKSSIAYIYWKETGDLSVWKGIAQDALVMNLDDLMCVGASSNFLLSSTIGRNKFKIPGEVISEIINGTEEFCQLMESYGINIKNMGGETADIGDLVRTIVVDSTFTARLKRKEVIEIDIKPGNVIVGLSSFGKTNYETEYNAGTGSNGLTSARHDLLDSSYKTKYPESFDTLSNSDLFYTGKFKLTDNLPGTNINIGKAILSPTRTYSPFLKEVINEYRGKINGIIHCTGGGQTKVMKFVKNIKIIKDKLLPVPPLFETILNTTQTSAKEMFEVFNMGHRMEIYTDLKTAENIVNSSKKWGIDSKIIGECLSSKSKELKVFYQNEFLTWNYE
ncbi:MAG: phosphoribosylformylglycinamidine cyclo-ligase [Bacteroidetes bacterium]|nr:phosphoribosylformylglycinamidine cyclo-ligase [Bacteroidota bacterium]